MTINATGPMIHLPFGERPAYGSPYPEGIAVGHIDVTGDATGGVIGATFLADGGFLYRFELFSATKGSAVAEIMDVISSHRWATDKSGLGATAFDLNWVIIQDQSPTFGLFTLLERYADALRRFPIGRTDIVQLQTLWTCNLPTNEDTILYDFDLVLTYWRKESLSMPGFLSSFYEAPAAPPLLRSPI